MSLLFEPLQLGAIMAPNRFIMAPMTRARGTEDNVPTSIMADYYAQRASAGLIISEAIGISRQGLGWPYATGIWNAEQIAGWQRVTSAVHAAGGRIIAQLWHMGRVVHSSMGGGQPVSASATTAPGHAHTYSGNTAYEQARPLELSEIPAIINQYRQAARNAINAGFDGIQLHASNGYLIDQFLRDSDNHRTDNYGGSKENRIRLLAEITQSVSDEVGADRVGVRLSPNGETQGIRDSDPVPLFRMALGMLSEIGIAHLELREPPIDGTFGVGEQPPLAEELRPYFRGPLILNSDFSVARAEQALKKGIGDAVSFGRPFISNPDFPERIAQAMPLTPNDRNTWFTQGTKGYTDYV